MLILKKGSRQGSLKKNSNDLRTSNHLFSFQFVLVVIYSKNSLTKLDGFILQAINTETNDVLGYFTDSSTNYLNCGHEKVSPHVKTA